MESWLVGTIFAAIFYGFHNVFTKIAAGKISDNFGGLILEGTAFLSILLYTIYLSQKQGFSFIETNKVGIFFSLFAGICVGAGTVLYFYIFRKGGNLSIAGPMVLVGGVLIMSIAGIILFKEGLSLIKVAGLIFGLLSLYLLNLGKVN